MDIANSLKKIKAIYNLEQIEYRLLVHVTGMPFFIRPMVSIDPTPVCSFCFFFGSRLLRRTINATQCAKLLTEA